jgi:hypothetical protein
MPPRLIQSWLLQNYGLTAVAIATLSALSLATVVWADVAVPVAEIVQHMQQTQIPVLLPSQVPINLKVYPDVTASRTSYSVDFYLAPNCIAGACYYGGIAAEQHGQFSPSPFVDQPPRDLGDVQEVYKTVALANGTPAHFTNACGAYCTATLEWMANHVLYRVTIKNGELDNLLSIANSAVAAGARQ